MPDLPTAASTEEHDLSQHEEDEETDWLAQTARLFASHDDDDDDGLISSHTWSPTARDLMPSSTSTIDALSNESMPSLVYHTCVLASGHGNNVWNASRCVAAHIRLLQWEALLGPAISHLWTEDHLMPQCMVELGAGVGLPSWAMAYRIAMSPSASSNKVLATDRYQVDQFRALQMSIEANLANWRTQDNNNPRIFQNNDIVQVVEHSWGASLDNTVLPRHGADFVVATDCIYDPMYHTALLESIVAILDPLCGVVCIAYSLHQNAPNESVQHFFIQASTMHSLHSIHSWTQPYPIGQLGIGSTDPHRGTVYGLILVHESSIFWKHYQESRLVNEQQEQCTR